MTTAIRTSPPPPPPQLPDDMDTAAAAQAGAQPPPPAGSSAVVAPPAAATPTTTPVPTSTTSAPPGAVPQPPPLPGAPVTATSGPSAAPVPVDNRVVTTEQDLPPPPDQPIAALATAQANYSAAAGKVEERNKALEQQLQEIGPALKGQAQRDAYTTQYHEKYAADYDGEAKAATALGAAINDPRNDFLAATNPAAAGQVANAVKTLATSPAGDGAVAWLASKFGAGASPEASATYRPYFSDGTIGSTAGDGTVHAAGSDSADMRQVVSNLQSLANGGIGGVALRSHLLAGADLLQKVGDPGSSPSPVQGLANKHVAPDVFEDAYKKGAGPQFEAAAYVLAAVKVAQGPGETPAEKTEYLAQIALAAQGGVQGTTATAEQLSDVKAFQKYAGQAVVGKVDALRASAPVLDLASRALGGLAGAAFGISDVQKGVAEGGNGFRFVAAAGDFASAAGFIIEGATPFGLVGIGLAAAANVAADASIANGRHDEEAALMTQAGVDPVAANAIAHSPGALTTLATAGDLSPDQIQSMAKANPQVFATNETAQAFASVVKASGLRGNDVLGLADAVGQGPDGATAFGNLASYRQTYDMGSSVLGDNALLGAVAADSSGLYGAASGYLHQHAPAAVQDASVRAVADSDYATVIGLTPSGLTFANLFRQNASPAYQSQLVANAAGSGQLPAFVDQVASSGSADEKQMVAQGIDSAYRAGALDEPTADRYRGALGYPAVKTGGGN